jgi:hypothetical protein
MNAVHSWQGRPVTELEKEELLEVIDFLVSETEKYREDRDRWRDSGDVAAYLKAKEKS